MQPTLIYLKPARVIGLMLMVIALGGCFCLLSVPIDGEIKIIGSLLLCAVCWLIYYHYWQGSGNRSINTIKLPTQHHPHQAWECVDSANRHFYCMDIANMIISPRWIIFHYTKQPVDNTGSERQKGSQLLVKRHKIMLHKTQVSESNWHQLCVSLRYFSSNKSSI